LASAKFSGGYYVSASVTGHTYLRSKNTANASDAQEDCESLCGDLVKITSESENSFVGWSLGGGGEHWTGLNDMDGDGTMTWMDGTSLGYENWCDGGSGCANSWMWPFGGLTGKCVLSSPSYWYPEPCGGKKIYVCEID